MPTKQRSKACNVGVRAGDPALPVAGRGALSAVRASKNSRRRALVLLAVHLAIAAHVTHYVVAGRTLSPIEPSEAMYTLELGQVNAGFVFFLVALVGTLIFGRFFCGWGCHIVALQDICGWMMKKLGIRPRPFRSRLLLWAPAALAFYMFFWPSLKRFGGGLLVRLGWITDAGVPAFPGFTEHLTTQAFWETFPGLTFTILTFLGCGFAAVYLLGAKGFCTYGCPYGAMFVGMDRLSPARIVVNDSCEQCGHCTVTCTSNVLVHEEVRRFGMVVDPGCMKCLDCVSVCPKGALSFGFARPAIFRTDAEPQAARPRRYPLGLGPELLVAGVAAVAALTFRGLYDGPPLLLSVGLGGMTGFVAWKLLQLVRRPGVTLQNLKLKRGGSIQKSGAVFAVVAVTWLAFTAHSGYVQWHRARGRQHLQRTEARPVDALSGAWKSRSYSSAHQQSVDAAHRHFMTAERYGLAPVLEIKLGLAWTHLLRDDPVVAESFLAAGLDMAPQRDDLRRQLMQLQLAQGRPQDAIAQLEQIVAGGAAGAEDHFQLGSWLIQSSRPDEAVEQYLMAAELTPDSVPVLFNLGGLLRRLGRPAEAIPPLETAATLEAGDRDIHVELGLSYGSVGRTAEAIAALELAIQLAPDHPEATSHLPELIRRLREGSAH